MANPRVTSSLCTLDIDYYRQRVKSAGKTYCLRRDHYEQLVYRFKRFERLKKKEANFQVIIKGIKGGQGSSDKIVVAAIGDWGRTRGADQFGITLFPSALGPGLIKRIARDPRIIVVYTPEHFTSMTCPLCHGFVDYDKVSEREKAEATGCEWSRIRDLKVCSTCNRHWNRDRMGAKNIAYNFLRFALGMDPLSRPPDAPGVPGAPAGGGGGGGGADGAAAQGKGTKRKASSKKKRADCDQEAAADTETELEGECKESGRIKRSRSSRKRPSRYDDL